MLIKLVLADCEGNFAHWKEGGCMKPKSERSQELYEYMIQRGYSEQFSDLITRNLNTDWTAGRMFGYLGHYTDLPEAEVVDEMLAILSDRNAIMQKKNMEANNAAWNEMMWNGFPFVDDDEDE